MEVQEEPRPSRVFFAVVGVAMFLIAIGVAIELAPVIGSPKQPLLYASATAAEGQVVIPSGIGGDPNLNYVPRVITVIVGYNNTVEWIDEDHTAEYHTVTSTLASTAPGYFDSGNLSPGGSWTHTFDTPGTYTYYCIYHGWMKGEVIVLAANSTSP